MHNCLKSLNLCLNQVVKKVLVTFSMKKKHFKNLAKNYLQHFFLNKLLT